MTRRWEWAVRCGWRTGRVSLSQWWWRPTARRRTRDWMRGSDVISPASAGTSCARRWRPAVSVRSRSAGSGCPTPRSSTHSQELIGHLAELLESGRLPGSVDGRPTSRSPCRRPGSGGRCPGHHIRMGISRLDVAVDAARGPAGALGPGAPTAAGRDRSRCQASCSFLLRLADRSGAVRRCAGAQPGHAGPQRPLSRVGVPGPRAGVRRCPRFAELYAGAARSVAGRIVV